MFWADVNAFPTEYAFWTSLHCWYINCHRADIAAGIAVNTAGKIDFYMDRCDFVKGRKYCSNGTDVAAPSSLDGKDKDDKE